MRLGKLLEAFENHKKLPIDLNEVVEWLRENGIQDEIKFVGVDLDAKVLRGQIYRYHYHKSVYGDPVAAANIYYDRNQEKDWLNFVCAKEIIHLLDDNYFVRSKDELDRLISRLALPNEIKNLESDDLAATIDKLAKPAAAALLLPYAARNLLLKPYNKGILNAEDIAKLAVIPKRYVQLVMSEEWTELYTKLKSL